MVKLYNPSFRNFGFTHAPETQEYLKEEQKKGTILVEDNAQAGFTPLPSNMALGATWNTEDAAAAGNIVGSEMAAVGINLLLGPSLDVLDMPRPDPQTTLGVRSLGGNSFWVGRLGRADKDAEKEG